MQRVVIGLLVSIILISGPAPVLATSQTQAIFKPTTGHISVPPVSTRSSKSVFIKASSEPKQNAPQKINGGIGLKSESAQSAETTPIAEPALAKKSWFDKLVDGVNGFGKGVADVTDKYIVKPVVDGVKSGIGLSTEGVQHTKLALGRAYDKLAGHVSMFVETGSVLAAVFNDPVQLADHKDKAIVLDDFLEYAHGKTVNELKHESDFFDNPASDRSAAGPNEKFRYVVDPSNPNRVIDMRHFLVVGEQGEATGLAIEIAQGLPIIGDPGGSSFHNQDFFSNALGARFFEQHNKDANFTTQLENFLKKKYK